MCAVEHCLLLCGCCFAVTHQVIDYKALAGDKSDNVPGVRGIGDKTAVALLQQYHSLEGILSHLPDLKPGVRNKLITDKQAALDSKELVTVRCAGSGQ